MKMNNFAVSEEEENYLLASQANVQFQTSLSPHAQILLEVSAVKKEMQDSTKEIWSKIHVIDAKVDEIHGMLQRVVSYLPFLQGSSSSQPSRSLLNQVDSSASTILQLHFDGQCPKKLYNNKKLNEQDVSLAIMLRDKLGAIVDVDHESSVKMKIAVLHGDFMPGESDLNANILHAREGKRPLLVGKCERPLSKGVVQIDDLEFTDNSSWVRSRKFRLGALVVDGASPRVVIKEAISEAFEVRERRGESSQKRETPLLTDEIWRLHNISKKGPIRDRLAEAKIYTVQDFINRLWADENSLKKIVQVSNKKWQEIVEHASSACCLPVYPQGCYNNGYLGEDTGIPAYQNQNELVASCVPNFQMPLPTENMDRFINPQENMSLGATVTNFGVVDMQQGPYFGSAANMIAPQQLSDGLHESYLNCGIIGNCSVSNSVQPLEKEGFCMASTSNARDIVCGADKTVIRSPRVGWLSIRAVLMFKVVLKIRLINQDVRPQKKQKINAFVTSM